MIIDNPIFGLKVVNLPILNIRGEFADYLALLSDERFLRQFHPLGQPIELPNCTFRGCLPRNVLTYMLQRSILGIESCVSAAVTNRLSAGGRLNGEMVARLNEPQKLPGVGSGMAEAFYNKLPAQVDPSLAMSNMYPDLWAEVRRFYKEVRNPLFHGYQLEHGNVDGVLEAHKMLAKVYDWMDEWWDAFGLPA